jgi:hypothetical protein
VAYLLCQDWHWADDIGQVAITRLTHWATASGSRVMIVLIKE